MPKTTRQFRLPDDVTTAARARAVQDGTTLTDVITEALREYGEGHRVARPVRVAFTVDLQSWQTVAGTRLGLLQAVRRLGLTLLPDAVEYDDPEILVLDD
jgi:hypothetical protein